MITLHEIVPSKPQFSEMLLAQIWEAKRRLAGFKFRINLKRINVTLYPFNSPLEYAGSSGRWTSWNYEYLKLRAWRDAGKPAVDLSDIEIGTW